MKCKKLALRVLSTAAVLSIVSSIAAPAFADVYDLTKGDISVGFKNNQQTVTQTDGDGRYVSDDKGEIKDRLDNDVVITTKNAETSEVKTTDNTVTINSNEGQTTEVTLKDATINVSGQDKAAMSVSGNGDTTIKLEGNNTLISGGSHAGLEKETIRTDEDGNKQNDGTLTITAKDNSQSLTAQGGTKDWGTGGAGIGSAGNWNNEEVSNIEISGGKITANGGFFAAGIGGGSGHSGDVTIKGGDVTATGGAFAAGIGGGTSGGADVTITNGTVNAKGGSVGIGAAPGAGKVSTVSISGGNITAQGTYRTNGRDETGTAPAGIGGDNTTIDISGGTITASVTAGNENQKNQYEAATNIKNGVGIGGKNSTIKISDGKINVTGNGYSGAGIGGADANITIIGGEINAAGKDGAAAIGEPANKNAGTIKIGGDAKITARGGDATDKIGAGAAIGNGGSSNNTSGAEADISVGDKSTAVIIRENGTPEAGHSHVFEGTPEVVEPTCTAAGQKVYTCSCGATETVILPAIGHAFGEWVPDGAGHKTRTCTRCNEKEKAVDENYVAPKPGEEPAEKPDEKPSDTDTTPSEGSTPETGSTAEETVSYAPLCVVGAPAYEQTVKDGRVLIAVPAQSASLTGSLHALKELKAKGAEVLVFRTQLCESTVSIDTLLAQGAETTTFILTHTKEAASLTVGGADHTDLLNK